MVRHFISAAALAFFVAAKATVTVPSGTVINIRLTSPVSSQQPAGKAAEAVVTVPVAVGGVTAIPVGAKLSGKTADVKAAGSGDEAATLRLVFDKLQMPGGQVQKITAELSAIDNARESVGSDGLITGIVASQTWYGRMNQGIDKVANSHQELAGLLGQVRDSVVKKVDASIEYPAGVDMQIKLSKALDCQAAANTNAIPAIGDAAGLAAVVNAQPDRTTAGEPPRPSDLTNLMFIGTQEELQAAFHAAGWSAAAARNDASIMETARAVIEDRGYQEAPVSVLLLNGKPPDLTFEKQTNTFSMRHHIRIWKCAATFEGQPVWVGAATHDTGVDFSAQSRTFTHKIDSNIDNERAKVTNDLKFSGYVSAESLVARTNIPADLSNATGDKLITDGKQAVLVLRAQPVNPSTLK